MAAPAWAPALTVVGGHIPSRTRAVGVGDDYTGTFGTSTTPTGTQVTALIEDACTLVTSRVGVPVASAAEPQCALAAALWAAYWVELGYPERDADVAVYERIRVDAEAATVSAAEVNAASGGGTTTLPDSADVLMPAMSFPAAPAWADQTFF